jgi:branched-chain amino acid aminotransferase
MEENNKIIISINGQLQQPHDAKISVFDRGFLFGDSIYEVTSCEKNKPRFWEDHLKRLVNSGDLIGMDVRPYIDSINQWTQNLLDHSSYSHSILRIIVTRGEGDLNLSPSEQYQCQVIIFCRPFTPYPKHWYEKGIAVEITLVRRNPIQSLNPQAKTGNYMNNQLALQEARSKGADDAIMCNLEGQITEGSTSNVWFVKASKVYTPDIESGLLAGITRAKIIDLCRQSGIDLKIGKIDKQFALDADEMFITSSTKSIVPITKINGQEIANGLPGPMTKKLISIYQEFLEQDQTID